MLFFECEILGFIKMNARSEATEKKVAEEYSERQIRRMLHQ